MQVRDGDPAFAAGDRHTRKFMDLEPASHSLRSRQAMPLQLWRRSRPGVRGVDNRDMRPRRRGVSQRDGMFGAGRRSGHAPIRPTCESMRSHARASNPLARGFPNMAGCEFSPSTMLRASALHLKRQRFRAAYGAKVVGHSTVQPRAPVELTTLDSHSLALCLPTQSPSLREFWKPPPTVVRFRHFTSKSCSTISPQRSYSTDVTHS